MLLDRLILGLLFLPTVVVHAEVFGTGVRALLPAGRRHAWPGRDVAVGCPP